MTNTARDLVLAVLANPLDDGPRFVLSDALQESGDPRGLFIVAQCRLAQRGLAPSERTTLQRQATTLLEANKQTWGAAAVGLTFTMRRGFIDEVEGTADKLVSHGEQLFANEPVTHLTITQADAGNLKALALVGAFARITHLTIRGQIGDSGARVLADELKSRTAPFSMLNVGGTGLGAEGIAALVPSLTGCRVLTLTTNALGDEGLTKLVKAKTLASLETLYLTDTDITDEGLAALAKSSALTSLARLGLARNEEITEEGLALVAASKKLKMLRWLEYSNEDGRQTVAARAR